MGTRIADVMPREPVEQPAPQPFGERIRAVSGDSPFQAAVRAAVEPRPLGERIRDALGDAAGPIWRPGQPFPATR